MSGLVSSLLQRAPGQVITSKTNIKCLPPCLSPGLSRPPRKKGLCAALWQGIVRAQLQRRGLQQPGCGLLNPSHNPPFPSSLPSACLSDPDSLVCQVTFCLSALPHTPSNLPPLLPCPHQSMKPTPSLLLPVFLPTPPTAGGRAGGRLVGERCSPPGPLRVPVWEHFLCTCPVLPLYAYPYSGPILYHAICTHTYPWNEPPPMSVPVWYPY